MILAGESCSLCSKDYDRVRAIAMLAYRVRKVSGTPPVVMGKLFIRWAELAGEQTVAEAMKVLMDEWQAADVDDPAEKEARKK